MKYWNTDNEKAKEGMMLSEVKQIDIHTIINVRGWIESIAVKQTNGWQKRKRK